MKTALYTKWSDQCSTKHPLYGIRIHMGDIKILEQEQRRAARYVYDDYTTRTSGCVTAMVKDICWESLEDRRSISRLSLLYKMQHGLVDVDTSSYLQQGDSRTRGRIGFFQKRINSEVYFNSFFPRTIREWNNLPGDVTAAWKSSGRV